MTVVKTQSENLRRIRQTFRQYMKAVAECDLLEQRGEILDFWFDLAYGVTPSIFVKYRREGEESLERVRLER